MNKLTLPLFLIGCIGARLTFAYIAKTISNAYLPYLALLAIIPVIGWLWIYFVSPRDTGPEVFGGKIWWNELRPVHIALYSLFILYAFQKKSFAYVPLVADAIFGLSAFLIHHYSRGDLTSISI